MSSDRYQYRGVYRRNLPHIQPRGATLFVTFRLAGSIPEAIWEQLKGENRKLNAEMLRAEAVSGVAFDPEKRADEWLKLRRRWFQKIEDSLHNHSKGPVWLKDNRVAEIVAEALRYRDGKVFRLDAYSIMPNHVHTVFAPLLTVDLADFALSAIMQSLKGYTARKCNLVLQRQGAFWQHESFDHAIRSSEEWERVVKYVLNNPVKAGLVERWQDWKWNYRRISSNDKQS
ncbi:MAG: transposase [Blastocatellia bacterium]|nr:transposase [Blastocatellia bacterium]